MDGLAKLNREYIWPTILAILDKVMKIYIYIT